MNQVMARSLNTSICAVLPVLSLLIVGSILMGATALQGFSLALLVGLITGAYSSIFIATPILALLKEREPRYRALKERYGSTTILSTLPAATAVATVGTAASPVRTTPSAASAAPGAASPAGTGTALGHPPRPRKKKKR
jgi:preprotein translocase subunit SecF